MIDCLIALSVSLTLSDIIGLAQSLPNVRSICGFCSRLRRGRMSAAAQHHGYNVLAMGHHLDDVAERYGKQTKWTDIEIEEWKINFTFLITNWLIMNLVQFLHRCVPEWRTEHDEGALHVEVIWEREGREREREREGERKIKRERSNCLSVSRSDNNLRVIRPLIYVREKELREFAASNHLPVRYFLKKKVKTARFTFCIFVRKLREVVDRSTIV